MTKLFKGTDPFFLPILVIIIIFFFMGEKVSSDIWETCPKILGGYECQNPSKWGLIYIYIYIYIMYVSHYNRNYLDKLYCKSENSHEQNVLRIRFYICYANFIRSVNPLSYYIYIYIYIYIYENYNRNYLEK